MKKDLHRTFFTALRALTSPLEFASFVKFAHIIWFIIWFQARKFDEGIIDVFFSTGMDPVNQWVDETTKGMIKKLLSKDPQGPAVLLNAVYFKGVIPPNLCIPSNDPTEIPAVLMVSVFQGCDPSQSWSVSRSK